MPSDQLCHAFTAMDMGLSGSLTIVGMLRKCISATVVTDGSAAGLFKSPLVQP